MVEDVASNLQGRLGGRLVPRLGDGRPALITHAPVIGREVGLQGEDDRGVARRKVAVGDQLRHSSGRFPLQRDRGRCEGFSCCFLSFESSTPGFALEKLQPDRHPTTAQEVDRAPVFGVRPRPHGGVDQRFVGVVDPEPHGVVGVDDEFVFAGVRGQDRPFPADRKLFGVKLLGRRGAGPEVEPDRRVDPLQHLLTAAHPATLEVSAAQPSLVAVPIGGGPETADQRRHGVGVLPDREPGKLHPGRAVSGPSQRRIKRLVNERRDLIRLLAHTRAWIVLGHRLADQPGQLRDRAIPFQGARVFLGAKSGGAVARGASSLVDGFAGPDIVRSRRESAGERGQTGERTKPRGW